MLRLIFMLSFIVGLLLWPQGRAVATDCDAKGQNNFIAEAWQSLGNIWNKLLGKEGPSGPWINRGEDIMRGDVSFTHIASDNVLWHGVLDNLEERFPIMLKKASILSGTVEREVKRTAEGRSMARKLKLESIVVPRVNIHYTLSKEKWMASELMDGKPFAILGYRKDGRFGLIPNPQVNVTRAEWEVFKKEMRSLHQHGVAHGDLNDGNIILSRDAQGKIYFKLIDWDGRGLLGQVTDNLQELIKHDEESLSHLENILFPH